MKKTLKKIFDKLGFSILSKNNILLNQPNCFDDQLRLLRLLQINKPLIFDVGAHKGETALLYNSIFNGSCTVYSFEPTMNSYTALREAISPFNNIVAENVALSNFNGTASFNINNFSGTNSLLETDLLAKRTWGHFLATEEVLSVDCITIDDYMKEMGIERIDILKIDTQGTENKVLDGANSALFNSRIKIIFLEILTMPTYQDQYYIDEILLVLRKNNYTLYNFYSSTQEHTYYLTKNGQLRQMDAIFISKEVQEIIY